MKSNQVFRLFKALVFILLVLIHKVVSGFWMELAFAGILSLYLIELYQSQNKEEEGKWPKKRKLSRRK